MLEGEGIPIEVDWADRAQIMELGLSLLPEGTVDEKAISHAELFSLASIRNKFAIVLHFVGCPDHVVYATRSQVQATLMATPLDLAS